MEPERLLAKRRVARRDDVTLEAHLLDTERAAMAIFAPNSRLRRRWLRFFKVPAAFEMTWETTLRAASVFHDIGKANEDFAAVVLGTQTGPQTVRHEHISAVLLCFPAVREWLGRSDSIDVDVLTAAVLSHHMKASNAPQHPLRWCAMREPREHVRVFFEREEIRRVLARIATVASLPVAPALPGDSFAAAGPWLAAWTLGERAGRVFERDIRKNVTRRSLHLAVKAALIVADAASSALVREGRDWSWIAKALHGPGLGKADIERDVLAPRCSELARRSGSAFTYHRFQDLAAAQGARALLLAGCGAGKTLAAWRWLAARAAEEAFGSAVFLYPTRGTATEGFRDYVGHAPEGDAALLHATAGYELERILENPPEALKGKRAALDEADARMFALGMWPRRYFSATIDQFLSFLEHGYASTCLLPRLVDSAVVIDEVHSFDKRLFDHLTAFLEHFDVPVLCMTATLSAGRRRELSARGLIAFPLEVHRSELADLEDEENHPRYHIRTVASDEEPLSAIATAHANGRRVLIVVNTVLRCQAWARRLGASLGTIPLVYHSRFRLRDRHSKHEQTVKAFQTEGAGIAVTTQVCEMSLDLDADLLVTELAPVPSLVQRFGRANRRRTRRGLDFRADVLVMEAPSAAPYEREDLEVARTFLERFRGCDASQRMLAEALVELSRAETCGDQSARFVDSGYYATPGALREDDESGGPALLTSDVAEAINRLRLHRPIDDLILPAPRRLLTPRGEEHASLPPHLGIVSGDRYDRELGLHMEEVE